MSNKGFCTFIIALRLVTDQLGVDLRWKNKEKNQLL